MGRRKNEVWKSGGLKGWKDGRMVEKRIKEWKDGRMVEKRIKEWKDGRMVKKRIKGWKDGRMVEKKNKNRKVKERRDNCGKTVDRKNPKIKKN